jgi:hypothetical protein
MQDYGMMNGAKVLEQAEKLMAKSIDRRKQRGDTTKS